MKKTLFYVLLQALAAAVIYGTVNERLPALIYPLSAIVFGGLFYISVKTVKTILNTRTVFAVLLEVMVSLKLCILIIFAKDITFDFMFVLYIAALLVLIGTIVLFIVFHEVNFKHIVRDIILTLIFRELLSLFCVLLLHIFYLIHVYYDLGTPLAGTLGILLYLFAFFLSKTRRKSYTTTDAIVLFIGTTPFVGDVLMSLSVLFEASIMY